MCVCVHEGAYVRACMYVHVCMCVCGSMIYCRCAQVCSAHVGACTSTRVYTSICIQVCTCVCMCTCRSMWVRVHMYICLRAKLNQGSPDGAFVGPGLLTSWMPRDHVWPRVGIAELVVLMFLPICLHLTETFTSECPPSPSFSFPRVPNVLRYTRPGATSCPCLLGMDPRRQV